VEVFGHAFSGVLLAQLLESDEARKPKRWVWPVLGACSALAPDIDGISIVGGPDAFKAWHQIYTHNFIAYAIGPPLVALLAWRLTRPRFSYARLYLLFQLGMTLHLLGDLLAQWPVRFLYPFSPRAWSFGLIPRDFSIGLALILMFVALLGYVDQLAPWRRFTAAGGLIAGVLYVTVGPGL
jgi:membrane-bound metal-dependent hydrolase YbcI (DUF457 family)